jgi:hypothetical protein
MPLLAPKARLFRRISRRRWRYIMFQFQSRDHVLATDGGSKSNWDVHHGPTVCQGCWCGGGGNGRWEVDDRKRNIRDFALFLIFCALSTHQQTHTWVYPYVLTIEPSHTLLLIHRNANYGITTSWCHSWHFCVSARVYDPGSSPCLNET